MSASEPIRDLGNLHALSRYFLQRGQYRNNSMIVLGVCTALRISDLLRLKWEDIYDEAVGAFRTHFTLTEQKTGKRKTIALNQQAIDALKLCLEYKHGEFIFASRGSDKPISRMQAWRIIHEAVQSLGITENISCHSLRKTWGYHAWTDGNISGKIRYSTKTDRGAQGLFDSAKEKGKINTMPNVPGIVLWKPGHVGVYVGNKDVIECTLGSRGDGIVKTPLSSAGWTYWLKVPEIMYVEDVVKKKMSVLEKLKMLMSR